MFVNQSANSFDRANHTASTLVPPEPDLTTSSHRTHDGAAGQALKSLEKGEGHLRALELGEDDPKVRHSVARKWLILLVVGSASICTTCASSMHSFTEKAIEKQFGVSNEVTILGISLFVEGLSIGPLIVGPLSEIYGRNLVYRISYVLFFVFSFPVAFAPNIAVLLVFRFVTGFCGSAFLSVAGGTVADLFEDGEMATPMAVYTITPFIGPVLGPLLSGFINQNTNWRWTYRLLIIWISVEILALVVLVPETHGPILLKRKMARLRKSTENSNSIPPAKDDREKNLLRMILVSCYKPFEILLYERMALLLDIWCALVLGVLYLTFEAFPVIFEKQHGFNMQETGLAFLGIGIGMLCALASQPLWNKYYIRRAERNGGSVPEDHLIMGMVGGVVTSISLFWLAFTTYSSVHWIVPIIASVPFGVGTIWIYICSFTYLVSTYRSWAASALAGNSFLRASFAAGFPLFAPAMYNTLGTAGATALLAGLSTAMAPLPFVFFRVGAKLRGRSKFTGVTA